MFDWRDELGIATRRVAELEEHFLLQTQRIQRLVQQKKSPTADECILAIVSNSLEHARSHKQLVESKVREERPPQSEDCAETNLIRENGFSPPRLVNPRDVKSAGRRKAQSYDGEDNIYDQLVKLMNEITMEADQPKTLPPVEQEDCLPLTNRQMRPSRQQSTWEGRTRMC